MSKKTKIFELKNKINEKLEGKISLESRDIQNLLEKEKGIKKSHNSNLLEEEVDFIMNYYTKKIDKKPRQGSMTNQKEKENTEQNVVSNNSYNKQNTNTSYNRQPRQDYNRQDANRQDTNKQNTNTSYNRQPRQAYNKQDSNKQNTNTSYNRQPRQDYNRQDANRQDTNRQNTNTPYNRQARQDYNRQDSNRQNTNTTYNRQDPNRQNTNTSYNRQPRQDYNRQDSNRQDANRQNTNTSYNRQPRQGYNRQDPNRQNTNTSYNRQPRQDYNRQDDNRQTRQNTQSDGYRQRPYNNERKSFDQQILDQKVAEKNENRKNRERNNKDKILKDKALKDKSLKNKKNISYKNDQFIDKTPRKGQFIKPEPIVAKPEDDIKVIIIPELLTIKELSDKMKMPSAALIKKLFMQGKMVSINHEITFEEAEEIALEYDIIAEKEKKIDIVAELLKEDEEDEKLLKKRPPVVCVMGHVDHGKTSLLDAIRETHMTTREAGGITQHIGAYVVDLDGEAITFLDTPGHEAFTSMRMRGAKSTDIAILVVAADDGVMPQTVEAINHAKAAGVEIIVAINKIDKPSANIERVKQELTEHGLIAEDWGGDTVFVPVSAHTKEGIDTLLEMINLTAEMLELKANPNRNVRGIVIEAELDKGRGPVATVLIQKGSLNVGDNIVIGSAYGKVRAMIDDMGERVEKAGPSTPVEILGLNDVPNSGEIIMSTDNEKEARTISEAFITQGREKLLADTKSRLSLDGLFSQIKAGNIKDFNLIIKADVQGSVEAMKQSLLKLSNEEVAVRIIHGGVGAINESDVILASASNAVIIGFNVRPDNAAKDTADREKVEIKLYRVIYHAIDDVEQAIKGMLDPIFEEKVIGHAEIRQTFKASDIGTIAGSYVLDGKITRGCLARITRDKKIIFDGKLASLKRFQDDVKEVASNYECGLVFEKFNDVVEGDLVELYIMAEVPR